MTVQLKSITQMRNSFAQTIKSVQQDRQPVIVIQGSKPAAVLVSYDDYQLWQHERHLQWQQKMVAALALGKQKGSLLLSQKNIDPEATNESQLYDLIANA